MSTLSDLVYSPLTEEEQALTGWCKATINYVLDYKGKVLSSIRGISKSHGKILNHHDADDIYMELLAYLYKSDDYNIGKAYERSNSPNSIVSLEGYVHACIKYVTIRFVTRSYEADKNTIRDTVKEKDEKELSLFDTIADKNAEGLLDNITYTLDDICKSYEYARYILGADIFQIYFVRLKTELCDKRDKYRDVLSILGISKRDLVKVESDTDKDGPMFSLAKAITLQPIEESLDILKQYVYCADKIEHLIDVI